MLRHRVEIDVAQRNMCLRDALIDTDRLLCQAQGLIDGSLRCGAPCVAPVMEMGQGKCGVGLRIPRVQLDRAMEHLAGEIILLFRRTARSMRTRGNSASGLADWLWDAGQARRAPSW